MRRPFLMLPAAMGALAMLLSGFPAAAAPVPAAEPKPRMKLCTISDPRLIKISGLAATEDGFLAVVDGNDQTSGSQLQVFELSSKCRVVQRHTFAKNPYNLQDLAVAPDGTLWVADTGDNNLERQRVAVWKIAPDLSAATLYRMAYPDGRHDAAAMLVTRDGTPVVITKDLDGNGQSGVYVPERPLKAGQTVPLTRAGTVTFTMTGTAGGPLGGAGQKVPTGAALSPDGTRLVVRTYTDAYEWSVRDGDVVAALTKGKPRRTPLRSEPQGEAISFSPDGSHYVTASRGWRGDKPQLYRYVPAKESATKPPAPSRTAAPGWFSSLDLQDIKILIGAVGVFGLVLLVLGVWGIRRARRLRGPDGDLDLDSPGPDGGQGGGTGAPPWRGDPRSGRGGAPGTYYRGQPVDPRRPGDPRAGGRPAGRTAVAVPPQGGPAPGSQARAARWDGSAPPGPAPSPGFRGRSVPPPRQAATAEDDDYFRSLRGDRWPR